MTLPRTWRPFGPRLAGAIGGGGLVVVMAMLWIGFDDETRAAVTGFQRGTVVVLFGIGLGCLFALVRSRVVAREEGLVVVNGYRRREIAWAQVVAVRFGPGAPWATLDLTDGSTVPVMGVQGSDGARARTAVRELRAVLESTDPPAD